jgi:[pyruvate, water dikinase]-phosphate phosphotransferase / [pyruvate, water dikinase] kinase
MIAKAALAQFDNPDVSNRHFWPMVRSLAASRPDRGDLAAHPGLVLYTLVNPETRKRLEEHCRHLGLPPCRCSIR